MTRSPETASFRASASVTALDYAQAYLSLQWTAQPHHDPYQGSQAIITFLSRRETFGLFPHILVNSVS